MFWTLDGSPIDRPSDNQVAIGPRFCEDAERAPDSYPLKAIPRQEIEKRPRQLAVKHYHHKTMEAPEKIRIDTEIEAAEETRCPKIL